jgi:multiple sugar transport system substrate-binding protein
MKSKKLTRRDFLRAAGAGVAFYATGRGFTPLFAQDPTATPAPLPVGQEGTLTLIHKTEYFEQVQTMFRDEVVNYVGSTGMELDLSTANPEVFGDFTAKMLAAVEAGNPPDAAYHTLRIQQMYALDIVEDVTDVVEQAISLYGAVVPKNAEFNGLIDGKWWGVPYMSTAPAWFARRDLFEAKDIDIVAADTWDARREAALAVSDPDNNIWGWGLTINRSGDAHGMIMAIIHAFGGSIVDETGLHVTFNSPETVAAVEWLVETYTDPKYAPMLPPGIEAWTDISNNEQYLAGTIALTSNQPSVYAAAKANNNPVYENTVIIHVPKTLDGRLLESGISGWFTIFKGAKNVDAAKDVILHMLSPEVFTPMAQNGGGLFLPAYQQLFTPELLSADPNFGVIGDILFNPDIYYGESHPAKPNALVDSVIGASIPSTMMANCTIGGMSAAEAVETAHREIVALFEESGVPQD